MLLSQYVERVQYKLINLLKYVQNLETGMREAFSTVYGDLLVSPAVLRKLG